MLPDQIKERLKAEFPDLPEPIYETSNSLRWKIWCDATVSFTIAGSVITWYLNYQDKSQHGHTTDYDDLADVIYVAIYSGYNTGLFGLATRSYKLPENKFI
jgi:hypothetical protein